MSNSKPTPTLSLDQPMFLKLFDGSTLAAEGMVFWRTPEMQALDVEQEAMETLQGSAFASTKQWLPMIEAVEARVIKTVLLRYGGKVTQAAESLGLNRDQLVERMKQLGLD